MSDQSAASSGDCGHHCGRRRQGDHHSPPPPLLTLAAGKYVAHRISAIIFGVSLIPTFHTEAHTLSAFFLNSRNILCACIPAVVAAAVASASCGGDACGGDASSEEGSPLQGREGGTEGVTDYMIRIPQRTSSLLQRLSPLKTLWYLT